MDHRPIAKRKRFRNSRKKFYVSEKHDPVNRSESARGCPLFMKQAAVSDDDPNDTISCESLARQYSHATASTCSENWRELSKQLGISTTRKRDVSEATTSQALAGKRVPYARHVGVVATHSALETRSTKEIETMEMSGLPHRTRDEGKTTKEPTSTSLGLSVGKCVSLDCEMVGTGPNGESSMLARCSLVNHYGNLLYDKFVAPIEEVTDYRTKVSGVRHRDLVDAPSFSVVQKEVSDLLKGKVLVGHSIQNDLKALLLAHPKKDIRDTANYRPFKQLAGGRRPSLKRFAKDLLGMDIQEQAHDSVQDARVCMRLYQLHKRNWELHLRTRYRKSYRRRKTSRKA